MGVVCDAVGDTEIYGYAEITAEAASTAAFCFGARDIANLSSHDSKG